MCIKINAKLYLKLVEVLKTTNNSSFNGSCTSVSPALWIMAAKNELEDRNSSESARHLFLRALRFHPNNKKVYQEVKDVLY